MKRSYQFGFSKMGNAIFYVSQREQKREPLWLFLRISVRQKGLRLLNVGSSAGIIDNYLASHSQSGTSFDIDEDVIDHARRNYHKDNLTFSVGDALDLQFPNSSFDVVICSQV